MTYEEIMSLMKSKKNDIDNETLKFFSNYFFVAVKKVFICDVSRFGNKRKKLAPQTLYRRACGRR